MGWQGLDIKIYLLNETDKIKIFEFEGDPDTDSWDSVKFDLHKVNDLSKYKNLYIDMENKSNIGKNIIKLMDNTIINLNLQDDFFYKVIPINNIKKFTINIKKHVAGNFYF